MMHLTEYQIWGLLADVLLRYLLTTSKVQFFPGLYQNGRRTKSAHANGNKKLSYRLEKRASAMHFFVAVTFYRRNDLLLHSMTP